MIQSDAFWELTRAFQDADRRGEELPDAEWLRLMWEAIPVLHGVSLNRVPPNKPGRIVLATLLIPKPSPAIH